MELYAFLEKLLCKLGSTGLRAIWVGTPRHGRARVSRMEKRPGKILLCPISEQGRQPHMFSPLRACTESMASVFFEPFLS